ncbi:MAG: CapA family protein [Bacillota bacterium]|nr:CapA family protein [Bacillota bacterium]
MKKILFIYFSFFFLIGSFVFLVTINSTGEEVPGEEISYYHFKLYENDISLLEEQAVFNYAILSGQYDRSIMLAAVGDIMIHSPQVSSAYVKEDNTYDFLSNYSYVASYIQEADFAIANLETTLAGEAYVFSGYPLFNSPPELASALKQSGFDLLATANNHSLDRGLDGVLNTIEHIEEAGLNHVGTARSPEERERGFILSRNDIKIAFYAYTYGTNGLPIPSGRDYLVSLIDEDLIRADVERAKNVDGVDLVIINMHWGNEYERLPSGSQREMAERLIDMGVNVIIGSHPHVIQPAEIIKTETAEGLVLYSLGNFISNQRWQYTDSGVIAFINILKNPALGTLQVSLHEIIPTWVNRYLENGRWKYKILPVKEVLDHHDAKKEYNLSEMDYHRIKEVLNETEDIFWHYWHDE